MIKVTSPSNIAIVKYWGKYGRQLPRNASVSFTLSNAVSETRMQYQPKKGKESQLTFFLDGINKPGFAQKIDNFFKGIEDYLPFLNDFDYVFESHNTFPHSSGIASSASGMSAVAMCLGQMEVELHKTNKIDLQKVSLLARLGSGSACRSVYPVMAVWGQHAAWQNSSNEYAICIQDEVHEVFHHFHDDILIVSDKEKSVSSTAGHGLMEGNPYASSRYEQANRHMSMLKAMLREGDVQGFGELAELEALTLHALMMSSSPSYILMQANTVEVIHRIRAFRSESKLPVYFTLDAGPNVHILYPASIIDKAQQFIREALMPLAHNGQILPDQVGQGTLLH